MTTWFLLGKESVEDSQLLTGLPVTTPSPSSPVSPTPSIVQSRSSSRKSAKKPKKSVSQSETVISIDGTAVYKNKSAEDSEKTDSSQKENGHNNGFLPSVNA
jgi:hypothetical protein